MLGLVNGVLSYRPRGMRTHRLYISTLAKSFQYLEALIVECRTRLSQRTQNEEGYSPLILAEILTGVPPHLRRGRVSMLTEPDLHKRQSYLKTELQISHEAVPSIQRIATSNLHLPSQDCFQSWSSLGQR